MTNARNSQSSPSWTRRHWLQVSAATGTAALLHSPLAAEPFRVSTLERQGFPRMLQEWYVRQVRTKLLAARKQREQLTTASGAEAYVKEVREKIRESFGPFPEKTPLNPKVTQITQRDAYTIENVIFESRPGFLVTANLYLPKTDKPAPGVVGTCGHSLNGKAAEAYQSFAQGLARQGYAVLIYDPIGQGERLQYLDDDLKPYVPGSVRDHLMAGNQQYLVGEFLGSWRAWDGIRALDYLLTRPEVDPRHVGVTGNSGGGTMTTWLCGLEDRWTMAAPSCFVTSFQRNLENELPADTEQCPPRAIELGLDHLDFLAAMAPKPVIILAKEGDYFDVRGSQYAYQQLKRLYQLLGAEQNISLYVGPGYHGYSRENREAMYGWFNRATGLSKNRTEPELTLEKDETLHCAPQGQVKTLGSKTVFDFTRAKAAQLAEQRKPMRPDELAARLRQLLKIPRSPKGSPPYRILRAFSIATRPTTHVTPYAVQTEIGIHAIVYGLHEQRHYSRPRGQGRPSSIYLADQSSFEEIRQGALAYLPDPSHGRFACDLRGIGESRPNTCGGANTYYTPYGNDYFYAAHGLMLGKPLVAQRTWDILRIVDFLLATGHSAVHLKARGWATIPAAFAALLDDNIADVQLIDPLDSYHRVATTPTYDWPLSSFAPGILRYTDLPAVYEALKKSKTSFTISTWNA